MTDLQKLQAAMQTLSNIRVPAAFTESVGLPIYKSLMMIDSVCGSIGQKEKEEKMISDVQMVTEDRSEGIDGIPTEGALFTKPIEVNQGHSENQNENN